VGVPDGVEVEDGVLAVGPEVLPLPFEPLPFEPLPFEPLPFEPPTIAGNIATVEPGSGTAAGDWGLPTGEPGKLGPVDGTMG
jgi:hypothetical protein